MHVIYMTEYRCEMWDKHMSNILYTYMLYH